MTEEKDGKETRIRAITKLYYSNPEIQKALFEFGKDREVVPRYFEGFGKRPDALQYPSDILNLVNKGATSFHSSEEIWNDPLALNTDLDVKKINSLRKGWDLLIDIDSPYLDFSKIAAQLLVEELENYGITSYAIKFSGSKGFHIIVPGNAFPEEYEGKKQKDMFPEWPRAVCQYLMNRIKPRFSRRTKEISNIEALKLRTNKSKEELIEVICPICGKKAVQDTWITLECDYCKNESKIKKSVISKKRILRCERCKGIMNQVKEEDFFECRECKVSNISKLGKRSYNEKFSGEVEDSVIPMSQGLYEKDTGGFDLVLVAPRHLFRMPYSLHEKTCLSSVIIEKDEIEKFSPKDANPLTVIPKSFYPHPKKDEALNLLKNALEWKKIKDIEDEEKERNRFSKEKNEYSANSEGFKFENVNEKDFPESIKKLMKGLEDGKKRGLFILITFLRCINFDAEKIDKIISEWNKKNTPPLKTGYIKSQLEWHFRQKRKILPPNYSNESFYKDLGLLDRKPDVKNPLVEVMHRIKRK